MLLLIDNYDSFTFNLAHYFQTLDITVNVIRNDDLTLNDIETLNPKCIVISPGPGVPNDAGLSLAIIDKFKGIIPILGVCLGHQCIAQYFGGKIVKAKQLMHGKTSVINHDATGIFNGLPMPLTVARYHSLLVSTKNLPKELKVVAWYQTDKNKEIMAIQHTELPISGVQFHPESILTEHGHQLLKNFIDMYNIPTNTNLPYQHFVCNN